MKKFRHHNPFIYPLNYFISTGCLKKTKLPYSLFNIELAVRRDFISSLQSLFSLYVFQELSKITMPVIFNEPLSFLQRLTEYMEHTYLIHQANASSDSIERMKVLYTL